MVTWQEALDVRGPLVVLSTIEPCLRRILWRAPGPTARREAFLAKEAKEKSMIPILAKTEWRRQVSRKAIRQYPFTRMSLHLTNDCLALTDESRPKAGLQKRLDLRERSQTPPRYVLKLAPRQRPSTLRVHKKWPTKNALFFWHGAFNNLTA